MSEEPESKRAAVAAPVAAAAADRLINYSRLYNEDYLRFEWCISHDAAFCPLVSQHITIQENPLRQIEFHAHVQKVEQQLQLRLMLTSGHSNGLMFHRDCERFAGTYQIYYKSWIEHGSRSGYNKIIHFLENEVPHMILHADKLYTREDAAEWLDPPHLAENRRTAGALCFQCDVPCGDFMALSRGHYGRENSQPCCVKCYMLMDTAEEETMSLDLYMPDGNMYVSDRYEDGRFLNGCEYKLIHWRSVGGECCAHRVAAAAAAAAAAAEGLSEHRLYELPTFKYDDSTTCSICREDFKRGDELRQTDCGHTFHQVCLDPWFDDHTTCPLCRVDCS